MDYMPKGRRIILTHRATVVVVMIMMIRMTIMEEKEQITYCKIFDTSNRSNKPQSLG
jgi:hypothetical protein